MRKMVPSELKGIRIDQTIIQVDKTGWGLTDAGGVNYFFKAVDITDLGIRDGDIVILSPGNTLSDFDSLTMQAIKDGLLLTLDGNNTIHCESLVNPSTYQNQISALEIQITIFRHSTL